MSSFVSLSVDDSTISRNHASRGGGLRAFGDADLFSPTIEGEPSGGGRGHLDVVRIGEHGRELGVRSERGIRARGHLRAPTVLERAQRGGRGRLRPHRHRDVTGVDPRVGVLKQNGGPTPTHALKPDSPPLGRGAACNVADQRGAPRSDCDSGSYELVLCLGRPVTIVGTPGSDELSGGPGHDVFLGLGGSDEFQGSLNVDRGCGGPATIV